MVGTYASAIAIVVAAVVLGRGVCVLAGLNRSVWLSPAVGFAALMVVCDVAIGLPGRGWTAVIAVVVACAASIWLVIHRHAAWPPLGETAVVGGVVLVFLSIPFLANARVGVLGIGLLNDTTGTCCSPRGCAGRRSRRSTTGSGTRSGRTRSRPCSRRVWAATSTRHSPGC